jgi:hypothetical protein
MPHRPKCRRCFAALPRVLAGVLLSIGGAFGVGLGIAGQPGAEFTTVDAYSLVELLALQRDNAAANLPLVSDANNGGTLLSVQDLNASTAMGARVFVGRRVDDSWGREAGYLGVYGMTAAPSLSGDGNLALAGPLASHSLPFTDGNRVRATWVSTINSAEFNAFRSRCEGGQLHRLAGWFSLPERRRAGWAGVHLLRGCIGGAVPERLQRANVE